MNKQSKLRKLANINKKAVLGETMTTFVAVIVIVVILIIFIVSAEIIKKVDNIPEGTKVEYKQGETGINPYMDNFRELVNSRAENSIGGVGK